MMAENGRLGSRKIYPLEETSDILFMSRTTEATPSASECYNQAADGLIVKLSVRGLKLNLETKGQFEKLSAITHAWQGSKRKGCGTLRSQSRGVLRHHESEVRQGRSSWKQSNFLVRECQPLTWFPEQCGFFVLIVSRSFWRSISAELHSPLG